MYILPESGHSGCLSIKCLQLQAKIAFAVHVRLFPTHVSRSCTTGQTIPCMLHPDAPDRYGLSCIDSNAAASKPAVKGTDNTTMLLSNFK